MSEKIDVGGIYEGKVIKIKPFGAIVSLPGNKQGLVHISHIANSYVQNVSDHLAIGDEVNVKVLSLDEAANKISLSIKEVGGQQTPGAGNENGAEVEVVENYRPYASQSSFEDKFKDWLKSSNERQAGLNKRNKRR